MNKKILIIGMTLLAVGMLVTPVMAVSPKKIPVTVNPVGPPIITPVTTWESGNVVHGRGLVYEHSSFNIFAAGIIDETGSRVATCDYNINPENSRGSAIWTVVITIPDKGTFEGNMKWRGTFILIPDDPWLFNGFMHAVFQGTGDYQGWTIIINREMINGAWQPKEAYLLVP